MRLTRRQKIARLRLVSSAIVILLLVGGASWFFGGKKPVDVHADDPAAGNRSYVTSDNAPPQNTAGANAPAVEDEVLIPETGPGRVARTPAPPREAPGGGDPRPAVGAEPSALSGASANQAIEAARQKYNGGAQIEARNELNAVLARGLPTSEAAEARGLLTRMADETIFSKRFFKEDALTTQYTVQSGEVLARICKPFKVPHETIVMVNAISRPENIRAGQKLKVPQGPFHAKIYKSQFRMDVYLHDLYVRSYRVGLGADPGTPAGVWKVTDRIQDPTYYPSASAPEKRVIAAGDPTNPLGDHWIALEGIEGDAVGQQGYGIHGTIEPDSIGKAVSLGCVRMHNEDVAVVFGLLAPGHSTVTVLP